MHPSLPVAALVVSAVMWGVTWWPLKFFNQQGLEGPALIVVAYGLVALALLPWLWRERRVWRGESRYLWLMFAFGGWANLAFASAMIYGEVVRSMMLFYLAPVWGVIGGRLFLGERIDAARRAGVVLALAGAFLVLGGWRALETPPSWVDLLALTAGLAFALNNVTCRAARHVPVASKTAAVFLGASLMAGGALAFQGELPPAVTTATWGWLVAFGLGWLLFASLISQWAVSHLEAGRASVILITELLAAVVSATLLGGETLSLVELAGGCLILAAALLEARRAGEPVGPPEQPVIL